MLKICVPVLKIFFCKNLFRNLKGSISDGSGFASGTFRVHVIILLHELGSKAADENIWIHVFSLGGGRNLMKISSFSHCACK